MLTRIVLLVVLLQLAMAIGSLALLAETVRALLSRLHDGWDVWARSRAAGTLGAYQYGGVKLAHAGGILIAAVGLTAGLWLAGLLLERLVTAGAAPQ